jgi:hypothetical protein
VSGPSSPADSDQAIFAFAASEQGSTFECQLDSAPYATCVSPSEFSAAPGLHVFRVRAIDPALNVDPSPASWNWTAYPPPILHFPFDGTAENKDGRREGWKEPPEHESLSDLGREHRDDVETLVNVRNLAERSDSEQVREVRGHARRPSRRTRWAAGPAVLTG